MAPLGPIASGGVNVRTQWTVRAVTVAAVAVTVAGCATGPQRAPASPTGSDQPVAGPSTVGESSTSEGEQPGHDGHVHAVPPEPPPAARAAPAAAAFAAAWARPSAEAWWKDLAPLCDEGFAEMLRTVDPSRVPATRVTGPPAATQEPADGVAAFEVPTDTGTVTVTLAGVDGRWVATGVDFVRAVDR